MPYLDPSTVLQRFSGTLLSEIRPTIPDDEELVRAQAGSMASTLRFLARELDRAEQSLAAQRDELLGAFDDLEAALEYLDDGADQVDRAVAAARADVKHATDAEQAARERTLLVATDDVLASIDEALDGDDARRCRTPLYRFLDRRVAAQHAILGREEGEGDA